MMDIEKLIERLKSQRGALFEHLYAQEKQDMDDAATALSTLQAENEKLRAEADGMRSNWYKAVEEVKNLRTELDEKEKYYDQMIDALSATDSTELEQVKQERDEAVQCIRGIAKSGRVWMCPYCVHAKETTGGIAECELDVGVCMMPYSKFEWCGQKED